MTQEQLHSLIKYKTFKLSKDDIIYQFKLDLFYRDSKKEGTYEIEVNEKDYFIKLIPFFYDFENIKLIPKNYDGEIIIINPVVRKFSNDLITLTEV